jgi:hypothetical protein
MTTRLRTDRPSSVTRTPKQPSGALLHRYQLLVAITNPGLALLSSKPNKHGAKRATCDVKLIFGTWQSPGDSDKDIQRATNSYHDKRLKLRLHRETPTIWTFDLELASVCPYQQGWRRKGLQWKEGRPPWSSARTPMPTSSIYSMPLGRIARRGWTGIAQRERSKCELEVSSEDDQMRGMLGYWILRVRSLWEGQVKRYRAGRRGTVDSGRPRQCTVRQ